MAVFADALFYVALLIPGDQHRRGAERVASEVIDEGIVTSEPVLVEVLAAISKAGSTARLRALELVDSLHDDERVTIVPQTHELFREGLEFFRRRLDRSYSLTDCMSMSICKANRIQRVLTNDHHFVQEGFEILL